MYAKIFEQIFDSSIAENYRTRHIFMDLLTLSRSDGVLDMTHEAIARRTNVPLKEIKEAIEALEKPDPESRSKTKNGARLVRLDKHREWGWRIVNYAAYRKIASEAERRLSERDRKRNYRVSVSTSNSVVPDTNGTDAPNTGPFHSHSSSNSSSFRGKGECENHKGVEIDFETAMKSVPIQLTELIRGHEDFARMVFDTWDSRDGKDGAGVMVRFAKHLQKRWRSEGEQWINGCHKGRKVEPDSKTSNISRGVSKALREIENFDTSLPEQ